jgi:hypothetical protein
VALRSALALFPPPESLAVEREAFPPSFSPVASGAQPIRFAMPRQKLNVPHPDADSRLGNAHVMRDPFDGRAQISKLSRFFMLGCQSRVLGLPYEHTFDYA